jgi:hypothetical protein
VGAFTSTPAWCVMFDATLPTLAQAVSGVLPVSRDPLPSSEYTDRVRDFDSAGDRADWAQANPTHTEGKGNRQVDSDGGNMALASSFGT